MYSPVETKRTVAVGPLVWGTILIVVGAGWLLSTLGIATIPWRAALAAVLVVVGLAMTVASASDAPPQGLFGAGVTLALILALLSTANAAFSLPLAGGVGDRAIAPTIGTLEAEYQMVAGQLDIDLGGVVFPEGETQIEIGVTFGAIDVHGIPEDVSVMVSAEVTAGEMLILGSRWDGVSIDHQKMDPDFENAARRLVINARVGFGQIEVGR
jgi:hypothetical protein